MRSGCRPLTRAGACIGLVAVVATLALTLLGPGTAYAGTSVRDQTPLPAGVLDETGGGSGDVAGGEAASSGGGLVRMIVGLAVVLAVIYGIYWLGKGYRKAKQRGTSDGRIEVLATTALAPNRAVHLLRVGGELLLVGSAEQGITKLRLYDEDEAAELTALLESSATVERLAPFRRDTSRGRRLVKAVDDIRWRTVR